MQGTSTGVALGVRVVVRGTMHRTALLGAPNTICRRCCSVGVTLSQLHHTTGRTQLNSVYPAVGSGHVCDEHATQSYLVVGCELWWMRGEW
jgi:hypothetical protein